jgi:sulfur-oxidizing protein SoxZ
LLRPINQAFLEIPAMTVKPTPRVRMPSTAKAGEIIEVKTLISHEMESGQRKDAAGQAIPRKIIKEFKATFNGELILSTDWHPAISANPYQSFFVRVPATGKFEFTWTDDDGSVYKAEQQVKVA